MCSVFSNEGFVMLFYNVPCVDKVSVVIGGSDTRFDTNLGTFEQCETVYGFWNSDI